MKNDQELKERWNKMCKEKAKVDPAVTGALGAENLKLEEWCQQIPGASAEVSVSEECSSRDS